MLENTAAATHQPHTGRAPTKARSRRERARYNGNSSTAKRIRGLEREYTAALGVADINPILAKAIKDAAELSTIAEELRGARLRGEPVDIGALTKAERLARRVVADLGIRAEAAKPVHVPLREQLAREAASWMTATAITLVDFANEFAAKTNSLDMPDMYPASASDWLDWMLTAAELERPAVAAEYAQRVTDKVVLERQWETENLRGL